jgi:hypothetical protein
MNFFPVNMLARARRHVLVAARDLYDMPLERRAAWHQQRVHFPAAVTSFATTTAGGWQGGPYDTVTADTVAVIACQVCSPCSNVAALRHDACC